MFAKNNIFLRKYEEIYPPEIGEFVYITDDTYTKQQVLRMEKLLLKVLSFDLNSPTTYSFINLYASMMNMPNKVKFMAQVNLIHSTNSIFIIKFICVVFVRVIVAPCTPLPHISTIDAFCGSCCSLILCGWKLNLEQENARYFWLRTRGLERGNCSTQ